MQLLDFVQGIGFRGPSPRFPAAAFDAYFASLFPAALRADPARLVFAAVAHAAMMCLNREGLERGLAIGVPGPDPLALQAASALLHPRLLFRIWPAPDGALDRAPDGALDPALDGAAQGRELRCLLLEGAPPFDPRQPPLPWRQGRPGPLVALLAQDAPDPGWGEASRFEHPGFALLVRA